MRREYVLFYFLMSSMLSAAVSTSPLQNEEQRKVYEKLQNIDTTIPSPIFSPEFKTTDDRNDSICFISRSIVVHNVTMVSEDERRAMIAPYIGKCNGIRALNALADTMTRRYIEKGYITSRVYLTPQDIADGTVDLYAIEGKIDHIVSDNRKTSGAFIGLAGKYLDLGDLETSIEQVNRLRSNTTTMQLIPSEKEGFSDVVLTSKETRPFFGSLGVNNYGSDTTGKYQISGGLVWENFIGLSDVLSINLNTTNKHQTGARSSGNSCNYVVPLGRWLWEAGASRFTYEQTIHGLNDDFIARGESSVYSLGTTYKLFHTRSQKVELSAAMAQKKTKSKLEDAVIESSTYNLTVGNIGAKYVYRQSSWEMYALLNYYHGLNPFNPTTQGALKHDFAKWTLALGATKYFDTAIPFTYNLSAYAQRSNDLLYSVEQINIGGAYSVRGYQFQGLHGNSGWYARNETAYRFGDISPYLGVDVGHISTSEDTEGGTLYSGIYGIRAAYKRFSADLYHAIPLKHPQEHFSAFPFIGFSISANF